MCGIAGILVDPNLSPPANTIDLMTSRLAHRGPDGHGTYVDASNGIYLGHRRLAIVDISNNGAQPMTSKDGRFVLVLNGEVYNFRALRQYLNERFPIKWTGTSDTEVLLNHIAFFGVNETLETVEGMFAFALWDNASKELTLARDRFGEKPLFIASVDNGIIFASELSALLTYPNLSLVDDKDSVNLFLGLSYVPEPKTIYQNVYKLEPAHMATLKPGDRMHKSERYWNPVDCVKQNTSPVGTGKLDDDLAIEKVEARLLQVISNQMKADVEVGAFLSGGIDSSLVVSLMSELSKNPVKTFTVGFDHAAYNEADFARNVARHLRTNHTEYTLSWQDCLASIERIPSIFGEPFADSSQIASIVISEVARKSVKVCLTGDGGDEVFGGYNRHSFAIGDQWKTGHIPGPLRRPLGTALKKAFEPRFTKRVEILLSHFKAAKNLNIFSERVNKLSEVLKTKYPFEQYVSLSRKDSSVLDNGSFDRYFKTYSDLFENLDLTLVEEFMLADAMIYLPGDCLTRVDRAAMMVGLETRCPLLDHRLYEIAREMPVKTHFSDGAGKRILKEILYKRVPKSLADRPKAGFGIPLDIWLRGPLRDWLQQTSESFVRRRPEYHDIVLTNLRKFHNRENHLHHFFWNVAMLELWDAHVDREIAR